MRVEDGLAALLLCAAVLAVGGFHPDVFAVGGFHTCAEPFCAEEGIVAGTPAPRCDVACWGENADGQSRAPKAVNFKALAAGSHHTCGIVQADDSARCFGYGYEGQTSPPAEQFRQLACGDVHSCGVTLDHDLVCWGGSARGQTAVPAGHKWRHVAAGLEHTCGALLNGSAVPSSSCTPRCAARRCPGSSGRTSRRRTGATR